MKPLLRWIVGGVSKQGLNIFRESLVRTLAALGVADFDWMVCYNNMESAELRFVHHISPRIQLYEQKWSECPLPEKAVCQLGKDYLDSPYRGTVWKLCPPRIRPDGHEIIMDNDIVIFRPFPALQWFLASDRHALLMRERFQNAGLYTHCFEKEDSFNSGFIGLPPGYDFGQDLFRSWSLIGQYPVLTPGDEQGLVTFVLKQTSHFVVDSDTIIHLHHDGRRYAQDGIEGSERYDYHGTEYGLHFSEANRCRHHIWAAYKSKSSVMRYYDEDHS